MISKNRDDLKMFIIFRHQSKAKNSFCTISWQFASKSPSVDGDSAYGSEMTWNLKNFIIPIEKQIRLMLPIENECIPFKMASSTLFKRRVLGGGLSSESRHPTEIEEFYWICKLFASYDVFYLVAYCQQVAKIEFLRIRPPHVHHSIQATPLVWPLVMYHPSETFAFVVPVDCGRKI